MPAGDVAVFHQNGNWRIRTEGGETKANLFETKDEAVEVAREFARAFGVELIIRNLDGTIEARDSHGHDPRAILG